MSFSAGIIRFALCFFLITGFIYTDSRFAQAEPCLLNIESPNRNPDRTPAGKALADKALKKVIVTFKETGEITSFRKAYRLGTALLRKRRKEKVKAVKEKAMPHLDPDQVTVTRSFLYAPSFAATVTSEGLKQLEQMEEVVSVETDSTVYAHTTQGLSVINAGVVRPVYSGAGVAVAIIDTGIDYTHPALGSSSNSMDFPNDKVIGGHDYGDNDQEPMDANGHGTRCAGIAAGDVVDSGSYADYAGGVVPDAKLYALKITEGAGNSASTSDIISAIEWCVDHVDDNTDYPIKVISISFGGGEYTSACDKSNTSLAHAVDDAAAAGITVFASSGNEGYCSAIAAPACVSDVISVGAVFDADIGEVSICVDNSSCADNMAASSGCATGEMAATIATSADTVAPYTNMSEDLDLLAPSHNASTPRPGSAYATSFGGTSAACPYAAGMAAAMQSAVKTAHDYFLTPEEIKTRMVAGGQPITYPAAGFTVPRVDLGNTDIDDDGLPSAWEVTYFNTIENDADTDLDEDGLTQAEEYVNLTDPTLADSDEDGMPDGWEVGYSLDPLTGDSAEDLDSDGYTNIQEYLAGTDPGNVDDPS